MMWNIPAIVLVVLTSGLWPGDAHGEMKTDLKKARDPFRPVELKTLKAASGANPGMVVYQRSPGTATANGFRRESQAGVYQRHSAIAIF
ncbi:MAG: hypothetical protein HC919_05285, partial [Oscillatoriales cyanobacterium SM2_2_1]|nr:hypothetical protein [Oscillatoriales cyanobacterium SM2_2_1]